MNVAMVRAEVVKLVARRGLFVTALVVPAVAVLIVLAVALSLHAYDPSSYDGPRTVSENATGFTVLATIVTAALFGATAGAWDVQNGTFRYLAMTGVPRAALFLARVPALLTVVVVTTVPAAVLNVAGVLLMPDGLRGDARLADHALALWAPVVQGWAYGIVALAVGALLRSVGAAIAVALVLDLAGLQLLLLLGLLDDRVAHAMLPAAASRLAGEGAWSVVFAAVALGVWLAVAVAAGVLRTVRAEY